MTRWASTANATAAAKPAVGMVTLIDLLFGGGSVYAHDGLGTLVWNGNTYLGVGDYGSLDVIDETTETIAKSVTMKLSGVPGTILTDAMTTDYQGKQVNIWVGLLDINALTWIANPEVVWEGRMDYMAVTLGQNTAEISLVCENRLNREPQIARYTDTDQQIAHPGDTFFNLTWQIPLSIASWGAITVQHPVNVPPTGRGGGTSSGGQGGRFGGGHHPRF